MHAICLTRFCEGFTSSTIRKLRTLQEYGTVGTGTQFHGATNALASRGLGAFCSLDFTGLF